MSGRTRLKLIKGEPATVSTVLVQAPAAALDCKLERAKGYVGKHYCLHETRRVHKMPYQLSVLDRARLEKLKEGLNNASLDFHTTEFT